MATTKQILANRRNAQNSTGPKTAEGRQIVSQNALTHGLTATRTVVLPEEQEEFDRFAAALRHEWETDCPLERFYLDRMIHCAWRLKRAARMESSLLLAMLQKESPAAAPDDQARLGRVYLEGHTVLAKLSRHERHLERSLREARYELELAQYVREKQVRPFWARNLKKFPAPREDPFRQKAR